MKTDLQIAQENTMIKIDEVAQKANIDSKYIEHYGQYKAKIDLSIMDELANKKEWKTNLGYCY